MKATKLTQKRAVFYLLWKEYQDNPNAYVPTYRALGELDVPELDSAFFMSYKTPTNGFEIFFENPDLVERKMVEGKSGAKYYCYKLRSPFHESNIKEESLWQFYCALTGRNPERRPTPIAEPANPPTLF